MNSKLLPWKLVLASSLKNQFSVFLGMLLCLIVGFLYTLSGDTRFPEERPISLLTGVGLTGGSFLYGWYMTRKHGDAQPITVKQGAQIVFLTWFFATVFSAIVFVLAGFPIPGKEMDFSLIRRFVDGIFESISGYTTAGGSILPSVEVFPRSILLWRSVTHLLGGMGMSYITVTLISKYFARREEVINAEAEGPNYMHFPKEEDARASGFEFMKIYGLLTTLLIALLCISGSFARMTPYEMWYDNLFDATNYAFSTMGTGGFGTYDTSAGLPITAPDGHIYIGGLQNPLSEWIIALFMLIAGANLGLWYILFFHAKRWKEVWKNQELRFYVGLVSLLIAGIFIILMQHGMYDSWGTALRFAVFNVATIISTTGLADVNFHLWPAGAIGILFVAYLVGGMVGSTAGGPKTLRLMIVFRYMWMRIQNFIHGRYQSRFSIDDVRYDERQAGLVTLNVLIYYIIFLIGGILIMVASPQIIYPDGRVVDVDLVSGLTASIANLGNIGPTASIGSADAGPAGNYFPFSTASKVIMSILMLIGRVGVLSILMLFVGRYSDEQVDENMAAQTFDRDEPFLRG